MVSSSELIQTASPEFTTERLKLLFLKEDNLPIHILYGYRQILFVLNQFLF